MSASFSVPNKRVEEGLRPDGAVGGVAAAAGGEGAPRLSGEAEGGEDVDGSTSGVPDMDAGDLEPLGEARRVHVHNDTP